jgi:isoleucyl-tRNA synthetase
MQPLDGYQLEREGSHAVALELTLDEGLRREGTAREIVHAIQAARKQAGLDISDRIRLQLGGSQALATAVEEHSAYITDEVLAVGYDFDVVGELAGDGAGVVSIDGEPLAIAVTPVPA